MKMEFILYSKEYLQAMRLYYRKFYISKLSFSIQLLIGIAILICYLLENAFGQFIRGSALYWGVGIISTYHMIFGLLVSTILPYCSMLLYERKRALFEAPTVIELTDYGIDYSDGQVKRSISWLRMQKWRENDDVLIIHCLNLPLLVIPKREQHRSVVHSIKMSLIRYLGDGQ